MIRVEKIQIPTLPTKKPRRLYIYTPKGYEQSEERYPVLYMFDGHNVFYDSHATYGKSWGMKQYLEKSKLPLILVAVECNVEGDNRMSEYTPYDIHWKGKLPWPVTAPSPGRRPCPPASWRPGTTRRSFRRRRPCSRPPASIWTWAPARRASTRSS